MIRTQLGQCICIYKEGDVYQDQGVDAAKEKVPFSGRRQQKVSFFIFTNAIMAIYHDSDMYSLF